MNLLYANDAPGRYPQSWYAATAQPPAPFAALSGTLRADVCVVGGGYTGLSAALHLAESGRSVVLLEAHRVGFGASGRNGGQLGSGQRLDQMSLEALVGPAQAARLWDLGEEAKALVRDLVARHGIDCALRDGIAWAATSRRSADDLARYADYMDRRHGYRLHPLDVEGIAALCPSPLYRGGVLDRGAAHLHPLRLAFGLARAAQRAGVRIHEASAVTGIEEGARVVLGTQDGEVEAEHAILACNGYLGGLQPRVAAHVMPINNFVVATEPLGDRARQVLTEDIAVADDRFVVNYFRLSEDGRLLFGGGESYGYRFPRDIAAVVRKPLEATFPALSGIGIDYAWGGTLAITLSRLPHLARVGPRILSASGYSGHGLGNAIQAGRLMAEAIRGQSDGFETFAALPSRAFPGGTALRSPLLGLAMSWYALRDRLGI